MLLKNPVEEAARALLSFSSSLSHPRLWLISSCALEGEVILLLLLMLQSFFVCFVFFLILLSFCSKEPSLTVGEVTYRLFDRVLVKINVDKSSTENKFLSFSIISKKVLVEDRNRILFHSILKGLNINPKLQTTLDAMFTL